MYVVCYWRVGVAGLLSRPKTSLVRWPLCVRCVDLIEDEWSLGRSKPGARRGIKTGNLKCKDYS